MIFYVALSVVDSFIGTTLFTATFSLALLIPSISIAARLGRSGWWQLIALIPLIGSIVLIVFLVQDSQADNEYGENPKAV